MSKIIPEDLYKKDIDRMVVHPKHYNQGKYEVVEVISDWKLNFNLGSAIKYIARCELKGNKKRDLEKAIEFIKFELSHMEEKYEI